MERSIEAIKETRNTAIDFIKINLLIGSVISAVYGSQVVNIDEIPTWLVAMPFGMLVMSTMIFAYTYLWLNSYVIGPSSGMLYQTLKSGHDEKEYYKIAAGVYHQWTDDNMVLTKKAGRGIIFGITLMFASFGTISGTYLFW